MHPIMRVRVLGVLWFVLVLVLYLTIILSFVGCETSGTLVEMSDGSKVSRTRSAFLQKLHIDEISYADKTKSFELKGYKNDAKDEALKQLISAILTP
jgi:hypothetical protein